MNPTLSALLTFLGTVLAAAIAGYFVYRRAVKIDRPAQERAAEQVLIDKWKEYSEGLERQVVKLEERTDRQDARLNALSARIDQLEEAERRAHAAEEYLARVLDHFQSGGGWPPPDRPSSPSAWGTPPARRVLKGDDGTVDNTTS